MKSLFKKTIYLFAIGLLSACSLSAPESAGSSGNEAKTLSSLQRVNDYPLYMMKYYGEYPAPRTSMLPSIQEANPTRGWACSLFTVLLDEDHLLYGRNFDWEFSPALLLFTDPPDGYASVSMVDIAYLGFSKPDVLHLTDLPPEKLKGLLDAPRIPFDGMNEQGLAIGMAAVPPGNMQADPAKKTIGSLGIIREVLDHARDVDEAVDLIKKYNIDFEGGPPVHYLIADARRQAVLVEFYQGEMHIFENEQPWHSTTNFLRSSVEDAKGKCWRYDRINARLSESQGLLDSNSAMKLLAEVAQDSTQWSIVYEMAHGKVNLVMGRDYAEVQTFQMSDYFNSR